MKGTREWSCASEATAVQPSGTPAAGLARRRAGHGDRARGAEAKEAAEDLLSN